MRSVSTTVRLCSASSPSTVATESDILLAVNGEASRTAGGIFLLVYDTTCSLVRNVPLSRSNKCTDGCATQPLLLSSP